MQQNIDQILKNSQNTPLIFPSHDDVIKWKHFLRYWPFVRGIHRYWSPVNSLHKGQCRRALMFSMICVWINSWVNNHEARDLRRCRSRYDVTVVTSELWSVCCDCCGDIWPCYNDITFFIRNSFYSLDFQLRFLSCSEYPWFIWWPVAWEMPIYQGAMDTAPQR